MEVRMSRLLVGLLATLLTVVLVGAPLAAQELPAEAVAQRGHEDPQAVKSRFAPQLKSLQIDIQTARVELARILAAPQPDRNQVKALIGRMLDLQRRQQLLLVDQMFDTLECMPQGNRDEFLQPIIDQLLR
jgi:Spy/CpxP family protein refolding chaperone